LPELKAQRKGVEGNLTAGCRVAFVDDAITIGGSSVKAANEVKALGCEIVLAVALVDRLHGAAELFKAEGIARFEALFTIPDFGEEVPGG
jgi:orotate phosphoribosyltransferase